jgi:hypothetical protein
MKNNRNSLVGGILLIGLGFLALLGQFVNFTETLGLLVLPLLAAAFLAAGILTRHAGFIIPGGILGGIGLGTILIEGPFSHIQEDSQGGIFLLSFAAGWALITILTAILTNETHWWPLIPGGIMAVIGGSIMIGGLFNDALVLLGKIWPVFLIVGGVYILLKGSQRNREKFQ